MRRKWFSVIRQQWHREVIFLQQPTVWEPTTKRGMHCNAASHQRKKKVCRSSLLCSREKTTSKVTEVSGGGQLKKSNAQEEILSGDLDRKKQLHPRVGRLTLCQSYYLQWSRTAPLFTFSTNYNLCVLFSPIRKCVIGFFYFHFPEWLYFNELNWFSKLFAPQRK